MGALQAEGIEQADGVLRQVAQGVGRGPRLVADRSAGVAVVVADDEPGAGVGGCSGAWPLSLFVMTGRSLTVAASSSWSIRQ